MFDCIWWEELLFRFGIRLCTETLRDVTGKVRVQSEDWPSSKCAGLEVST